MGPVLPADPLWGDALLAPQKGDVVPACGTTCPHLLAEGQGAIRWMVVPRASSPVPPPLLLSACPEEGTAPGTVQSI